MIPKFDTMKYKCSVCGSTTSHQKDKHGNERWYRNKQAGIGFICKNCYNIRYNRQKKIGVSTV